MKKILYWIIGILTLLYVFPQLISFSQISGGDYITYWPEHFHYFSQYPFIAWDPKINLGWSTVGLMHYDPYSYLIGFVGRLVNNAVLTEKILIWIPFIVLCIFSSRYLYSYLFPKNKFWIISSFVFLFNTYVFMVIGGGQITGIGFAYALAPLVLQKVIELFEKRKTREIIFASVVTGLLFSLQMVFDLRVTYSTLFGSTVFFLFLLVSKRVHFVNGIAMLAIPVILFLLHAFWILPLVIFKQNPIEQFGAGHATTDSLRFLSFATFENAISLLHPNWPENIFGKVSFFNPIFLFVPIVAFSSLLFIQKAKHNDTDTKRKDVFVLYFSFLALLGAFLAKGAQEPFGAVYIWLFDTVPGFVMFRDPTKWYLLIAVAYTVLIPRALQEISQKVASTYKARFASRTTRAILLITFILFWLISIFPAVSHRLTGTFTPIDTPDNYKVLRTFIRDQNGFFRTLWVPQQQRYGYFSSQHPILNAHDMLGTFDRRKLYEMLSTETTHDFAKEAGVKYIIVPDDTRGDIFLEDRMYSEEAYKNAVAAVAAIPWVTHVRDFGKIKVFAIDGYQDRFRLDKSKNTLSWHMINPAHYQIEPKNGTIDGQLVFSERYDPGWVALYDGKKVQAKQYNTRFISFHIEGEPDIVAVYYAPQTWVNRGILISGVSLLLLMVSLLFLRKEKKYD